MAQIKYLTGATLIFLFLIDLVVAQIAASTSPKALPSPSPSTLQQSSSSSSLSTQQREEVEEIIEKSNKVGERVQSEVDRAVNRSTSLIDILMAGMGVLIAVLTLIPIALGIVAWFLRKSLVEQLASEVRKELTESTKKYKTRF
ncbi:MAG: hypothetical protein KME12_10905 [Trichocoleus desertorum ATA4-8-CV12]|nr:hypothetical protein [Trichocoleus desertorum ATA4-8-CV12]